MRISFDIDDTLVCRITPVPSEPCWLARLVSRDRLRLGSRSLLRALRQQSCEVFIYTSSQRSPFTLRLWLLAHGIWIDGIVNAARHHEQMRGRRFERTPSKYPPAFGIDLHVDDSEGVRMEGEQHGFRVVVVSPQDSDWTRTVLDAVSAATRTQR